MERLKKSTAAGLVIVIAIVALALSKGIVRSFFHKPTNVSQSKPDGRFIDFDKPDGRAQPSTASAQEKERDAEAHAEIEKAHPGWKHTVGTPQFSAWLAQQAEQVRKLAASEQVADTIRLLDKFSADMIAAKKALSGNVFDQSNKQQDGK